MQVVSQRPMSLIHHFRQPANLCPYCRARTNRNRVSHKLIRANPARPGPPLAAIASILPERRAFGSGARLALRRRTQPLVWPGERDGDDVNAREKAELGARLKRIAGQVAGIERMLDDDRPLADVITQVSAARAALGSVASILLTRHVEQRATEAIETESPRERRELIDQLVRLFEKREG